MNKDLKKFLLIYGVAIPVTLLYSIVIIFAGAGLMRYLANLLGLNI